MKVIIIGAGGHAAELRDYISYINSFDNKSLIEVEGFIDDNSEVHKYYGYNEPYLGGIKEHVVRKDVKYLMGIANLTYRMPIILRFKAEGAIFTGLIHPTALISASSEIGEGTVISHNASVGPKVKIGIFNMLNSRCTIGHDTTLGDFNFISPQVALGGNTKIGNNNLIGTNACTIPGICIGSNNKIAAGMTVFKNVGDEETVFYRYKERIVIKPFGE
jgi:acetyltransferase EpsM